VRRPDLAHRVEKSRDTIVSGARSRGGDPSRALPRERTFQAHARSFDFVLAVSWSFETAFWSCDHFDLWYDGMVGSRLDRRSWLSILSRPLPLILGARRQISEYLQMIMTPRGQIRSLFDRDERSVVRHATTPHTYASKTAHTFN